ncbi:MAG: hypothetical protein WBM08_13850 [Prochlorococcaceae cyanobacterium]
MSEFSPDAPGPSSPPSPQAPSAEPDLRGYVFTTYTQLLERLPPPDEIPPEGSHVHWTLGTSFGWLRIYDRNAETLPRGRYLWHVAAADAQATGFVTALVGEHFTPLMGPRGT